MSYEMFEAYQRIAELVTDAMPMPVWSPDGASAGLVVGHADDRRALRIDLSTGAAEPLCNVAALRAAIQAATGTTPAGRGVPFAAFGFLSADAIAFAVGTDTIHYDLRTQRATRVPPPSFVDAISGSTDSARRTPRPYKRWNPLTDPVDGYEAPSPDGRWMLSVQRNDLSVRSTYDGVERRLTTDGTESQFWWFDWTNPMLALLGLAVPVANWSPDGQRIAAYRIDVSGVATIPQSHFLERGRVETVFRHAPRAGGVLETSTLYVVDVAGRPPVTLDVGDTRDTYPVYGAWLPDGSGLVVVKVARDCRSAEVLLADAHTGCSRALFRESSDTFIRVHHDVYYGRKLGLTLTPQGREVLWLSARDGHRHIYVYDLENPEPRQLTQGPWEVVDVQRVAEGHVYFTAHSDPARPYDVHLCRVPLAGGPMQQLTSAPGCHLASFAPNGRVFFDTHSSPDRPPTMELRTIDGRCLSEAVVRADVSRLQTIGWTPPIEFSVKAADGVTDLWGVLYRPHDFDPSKSYPVLEYIYGGPQVAFADHGFCAGASLGGTPQALAQLGYVTFVLDSRGTPERGRAFHATACQGFVGVTADDHAAAVRQLGERFEWFDASRVAITGGSWGGYFSTRLVLDRPDTYRCAVSTSPGYDPYSSNLYEGYLGFPQRDPANYAAADLTQLAPKLSAGLMIACGTIDHFCWGDALRMAEALIRAGKDFDFVALPAQGHGYDTVHNAFYVRKLHEFCRRHVGEPKLRGA